MFANTLFDFELPFDALKLHNSQAHIVLLFSSLVDLPTAMSLSDPPSSTIYELIVFILSWTRVRLMAGSVSGVIF